MTQRNLETVIGKLVADEDLRGLFRKDPKAAVDSLRAQGYELSDVEGDLRELQSSFEDLTAEQREELQPEIDELESQVRALGDAESLDDLSAEADEIVSSLDSILGQIGDSLSC